MRISVIVAAAVTLAAAPAFAQSDIAPRAAVSFVGGFGSATSTTGVLLGGSALFDLNDRASLEAQGTYLDRGAGADALSVGGSVLLNLLPVREQIVPYAAIGGGVYRASFDLANPRFFGPIGTDVAAGSLVCPAPGTGMGMGYGQGFGPGTGTCPATTDAYWGVGQMSDFYARRLGGMTVPASGVWGTRRFVDPAVSIGGGVRFNLSERVMLRPDVRALVIFGDGDTHTMAVFGMNVGYRF